MGELVVLIIAGVIVLGVFGAIRQASVGRSNRKRTQNALMALPQFNSSVVGVFASGNGIAIDIERESFAIVEHPGDRPVIIPFTDLIAAEMIIDDETTVRTNRGSQAAGAVVGAAIFGPAGAIIGGLSGSRRKEAKISKAGIRVFTNHLATPVREVLVDFKEVVDRAAIKNQVDQLYQWYGRFQAVLERRTSADRAEVPA